MVTKIGARSPQFTPGLQNCTTSKSNPGKLNRFWCLIVPVPIFLFKFIPIFLSGPCTVGYLLVPLMALPDPLAMWTKSEKHWLRSDRTLLEPIYVDQSPSGTSLVIYIVITGIPMTMVEYLTRVRWKGIHEEPRRTNECTVHDVLVAARSLARSRFRPFFFASGFVIASLPSLGCQR
jgi:hypothetical protein